MRCPKPQNPSNQKLRSISNNKYEEQRCPIQLLQVDRRIRCPSPTYLQRQDQLSNFLRWCGDSHHHSCVPLLVDCHHLNSRIFPIKQFHFFSKDAADQQSRYTFSHLLYELRVVSPRYKDILNCPAGSFSQPRPFYLHIGSLALNYVRHHPRTFIQVFQLNSMQQHSAKCFYVSSRQLLLYRCARFRVQLSNLGSQSKYGSVAYEKVFNDREHVWRAIKSDDEEGLRSRLIRSRQSRLSLLRYKAFNTVFWLCFLQQSGWWFSNQNAIDQQNFLQTATQHEHVYKEDFLHPGNLGNSLQFTYLQLSFLTRLKVQHLQHQPTRHAGKEPIR